MRNGLNQKSCCQKRKWDVLALICAELKTGSSWRALPCAFDKWNSVYRYFCRLQQKGVFKKIFAELTKDQIPQELSLDSTFVKVHRHRLKGLERHIGKSKGGNLISSADRLNCS